MNDTANQTCSVTTDLPGRRCFMLITFGVVLLCGTLRASAADDSGCKPVLDAIAKIGETPNHQYNTLTNLSGSGVRENEVICVGEVMYVKVQGRWTIGPITPKQMAEQQQDNIRSAKVYHCKHDRDEKVGGEMAAVYKAHSENEDGVEDAVIWISKSRGLILRETVESKSSETLMSARFVYTDVKAPELQ